MNHNFNNQKRGFTLVEILVVLTIVVTLVALLIPRIRTINVERNLREASRVVGSQFANASQRAVIDGVAGVLIRRNANFRFDVTGTNFPYAATELAFLRNVPSYTGDTTAAMTSMSMAKEDRTDGLCISTIQIDYPLEQDSLNVVRAGDSISFGNSSVRYRISNVRVIQTVPILPPTELELTLERGRRVDAAGTEIVGDFMPMPGDGESFEVQRLPRVLRSSIATLPQGFLIDLRFSGFEVLDQGDLANAVPPQLTSVFEPFARDLPGGLNAEGLQIQSDYDIAVIFDETGAVDRVYYAVDYESPTGAIVSRDPLGPLYFFVNSAPTVETITDNVASSQETPLWITLSNSTGITNVGFNSPASTQGLDYATLSSYYDGAFDVDTNPDMDRDEFNALIQASRTDAADTSANN